MRRCLPASLWLPLTLCVVMLSACVPAGASDRRAAEFLSGPGTRLYLGLGLALPLLEDGSKGRKHAVRSLDAVVTAALISEGLKRIVREKRPDTGRHNSFPSGHATGAFAVAAMESAFHPRQAALWYAGATLIAASRVRLHRHYIHDVIAGAALGYFVARWERSQSRGLILAPCIGPDRQSLPLQIRKTF